MQQWKSVVIVIIRYFYYLIDTINCHGIILYTHDKELNYKTIYNLIDRTTGYVRLLTMATIFFY